MIISEEYEPGVPGRACTTCDSAWPATEDDDMPHHHADNCVRYFAAVGTDGTRLVVWGLGSTPSKAIADGCVNLEYEDGAQLTCHEITAEQDERLRDGEVSWSSLAS